LVYSTCSIEPEENQEQAGPPPVPLLPVLKRAREVPIMAVHLRAFGTDPPVTAVNGGECCSFPSPCADHSTVFALKFAQSRLLE
jgi:16S rRNA C967 or C1407 C5-methylase (RsmB/RsmF family)